MSECLVDDLGVLLRKCYYERCHIIIFTVQSVSLSLLIDEFIVFILIINIHVYFSIMDLFHFSNIYLKIFYSTL